MKDTSKKDQEIAGRLRAKLTEKRIKLAPLADVIGVAPTTIYQKMSGGSGLTLTEFYLIATACCLTREEVNYILFG